MTPDNRKSLMALGSAAVIGVYAAGWFKTKAAADRFASEAIERRPPAPSPAERPHVRAVERVTPPSAETPVRLRAGATAATPTLPPLTRSGTTPSAASPKGVPVATQSTTTVASAAPAVTGTPEVPPQPAPAPNPQVDALQAPAKQAESPAQQHEAEQPKWKDGTYYGWGTSRHGDIQAAVTIEAGRIASAVISQCLTRYSCSWIAALPPQVAVRQSAEVDYVSGATQSTNAFYYAVLEALAHAK